jgi:flagellar biosynthesis protein FliR
MMQTSPTMIERKLRMAAVFILVGLTIQLATFFVNHPLAFMAFIIIGFPLVVIGAVMYLWSMVMHSEAR